MSADDYGNQPDLAVLANEARRAATITPPARDEGDHTLVIVRHRQDEQVDTIDLERYEPTPRRARGETVIHDPEDFATYVQRAGTSFTTVWADQTTNKVTAIVNDQEVDGDQGWRDHTVVLDVLGDPEWQAWVALDKRLMAPVRLAEHLEDYGDNVTRPTPADMLTIAQSIRATKTAEIEDTQDSHTGAVRFQYVETVQAKAGRRDSVEIPTQFLLEVPPYLGYPKVELGARLRFQVGDKGGLEIGYQLIRPDLVKREAFAGVRRTIATALGDEFPVLLGKPPLARP